MKNKKLLFITAIATSLLLSACGNSGSSDSTTSSGGTSETTLETTTSEETTKGFAVTFNYDEHVTVTVYTTKEYSTVDTDTNYQTRNGDTGEYCNDGEESQVNFKIVASDGYEIETVTATAGTYNKVKWPSDTLVENGYRLTKVTANTEITITTKSKEAAPEGYKVTFALEHCTVNVHVGKDTTTTDTPDTNGDYFTRDKDSAEFTKNSDTAQVNFTVVPEEGYEFVSGVEVGTEAKASAIKFISGTYNKLKNNDNNYYTVTKVQSDLVITLTCTAK